MRRQTINFVATDERSAGEPETGPAAAHSGRIARRRGSHFQWLSANCESAQLVSARTSGLSASFGRLTRK